MKPQSLVYSLFFIGVLLFTFSCQAPEQEENTSQTEQKVGIPQQIADNLQLNWKQATNDDIGEDFYLEGDSAKVLTFNLSRAAVDGLIEQYKQGLLLHADSLLLRINMALFETKASDSLADHRSNFRPIVELATEGPIVYTSTNMVFQLPNKDVDILRYLDSLLNVKFEPASIPISLDTAKVMITEWDITAENSIPDLLYEDEKKEKSERVRFYTFDKEDTQLIFQYLDSHPNDEMYLHLGVHHDSLGIPLRTIIHLDNPARLETMIDIDANDPPFFEFASPCPKACGNQSI